MSLSFKVNLSTAKAVSAVGKGAEKGLQTAAEFVLTEANKVVPHEEGTLMRSGAVDVDAGSMTAAVSYDTPYAVRQHEDMTLRHDAGRRAKYLEATMTQESGKVGQILAAAIRGQVD